MLRAFFVAALFALQVATPTSADAQQDESPLGFSVGGSLWAEIGASECSENGLTGPCASGQSDVFPGATVALDLDLLHWLRLGVNAGLGYLHEQGGLSSSGERTTFRHWFVPLTLHSYWRVELGKRITLWGGPELGLALYVDQRRRSQPGARAQNESSTRSAFLAGVAVGLDVRLISALRVGLEVGEAILVKGAADDARGDRIDLRAMTRCALVLRYL